MNTRKLSKALDHKQVKELANAAGFADKRGKKLNTTVTIHPKLLARYPSDVGLWVSDLTNKIRIWCERKKFGYFAIWVRENYIGDRREHLHVMLYVPERQKEDFDAALRRWLPGDERVVRLGKPQLRRRASGTTYDAGLTYLLKQMTARARWALGQQVRRETECRTTHQPVAPVLGKRCGVSRSLDAKARTTFWQSRSPSAPVQRERHIEFLQSPKKDCA